MIHVYTTYVNDTLSPAEAIDEINYFVRAQPLYANTVGIIHCHADFVDDEHVQAICDVLPFETVGCSTTSLANDEVSLQYGLTLTILTSDDVQFHTGVSPSSAEGLDFAMGTLHNNVIASLPERPKLIIPFIPFLVTTGGDEFISRLNALTDYSIPFFGTLPISAETDYSRCYTIHNGRAYIDSAVLLAVSGNVTPRFITTVVASEEYLEVNGAVTAAEKNLLISIDNIPAEDFLVNNGLVFARGMLSTLSNLELIIDLPTGERLIRNCIAGNDSGGIYLTGHIPALGSIHFAKINAEFVVRTSREIAEAAANAANGGGMLMYSCTARNWILTENPLEELDAIRTTVGARSPFSCSYSGGEIYPQQLPNGNIAATLQNSSFIICLL
ncbi:MAG: FIST C-terminal domain-containing protein [Clostridiales Family XIII bacterium]|jgi:hypothetical protein|nr:FIST C-terminal domain-containing protein [Clostridiales Family XIII bacterium]